MPAHPCVSTAEAIKSNTTLEELLLNGNAIGDDGARHLMAALKSNNTLECLSLQVCEERYLRVIELRPKL